jgi:hypothetical protein
MGGTALKTSVILTVCGASLALPFVGTWLRQTPGEHCALDGASLVPCYRVCVQDAAGRTRDFCCLRCAEMWVERQSAPVWAIRVTDEATGDQFAAADAHYVRSRIVTTPTTGNRIHVFRDRKDAERHALTWSGTILTGSERPFARSR